MSGKLSWKDPGTDWCEFSLDERVDFAPCRCIVETLPSPTGEVIVLRVVGEVDLVSIWMLKVTLTSSIDRQPAHIVVDLEHLQFCSAQGMGVLFGAAAIAAERGCGFAVSGVSSHLNRIWETLWLDELPPRYDNMATAVHAIRTQHAEPRTPRPLDVIPGNPHLTMRVLGGQIQYSWTGPIPSTLTEPGSLDWCLAPGLDAISLQSWRQGNVLY